jgi:RNA recognition motif-containing protein
MVKKLFVGNLDRTVTNSQLEDLFSAHGTVVNAAVVFDRQTGESRRFGFVEMASHGQADTAIKNLDGTRMNERNIRVSPARERKTPPREGNQRLRLRLPFRLVSSRPRHSEKESS